ncbi:MAG: GyrI-like domain-containing protein [Spirochaetales bacterium]|nr:GyrI-like domain-containing protein [Spirochaetales bacterium]
MEKKLDLKKTYRDLYNPPVKEPVLVEIPERRFLMIDGMDARPESESFQQAINALFSVSYKIKFGVKKKEGKDYTVMPLEGLWWADDMDYFKKGIKAMWQWTLMIMQPDFITPTHVNRAVEEEGKKDFSPALDELRLKGFREGWCGQIMHIGPFSAEEANIRRVHQLISESGGRFDGQIQKHHEIYLSDFRKVRPEKMKTVVRQPFVKDS